MELLTFKQIKDKIERDLDLQGEDFIQADELLGYVNEAIDDVEASIHTLGRGDEYFLKTQVLPLVAGTSTYSFPSDIYGMKIKKVLFDNGVQKYEIRRIKDFRETMYIQPEYDFRYVIKNSTPNSRGEMHFFPTPVVSDSASVTIWYLRNANKLTSSLTDTDNVCDIPEFVNYVMQHAKTRCYEKDVGNPMIQKAITDTERLRNLMLETLAEMVIDEDNKIPLDLHHYYDMDTETYYDK